MDAAAHYRHLAALGRDEFLAAAAPAALVRFRSSLVEPVPFGATTMTLDADDPVDETLPHGKLGAEPVDLEIYPLAKKPGASFPDRITIGRTPNNDVVIPDHSVSRLHAYVKPGRAWVVADAGSKNGSWLRGHALEPRREVALPSKAVLRLGDVDLTFFLASDLFDALVQGAG